MVSVPFRRTAAGPPTIRLASRGCSAGFRSVAETTVRDPGPEGYPFRQAGGRNPPRRRRWRAVRPAPSRVGAGGAESGVGIDCVSAGRPGRSHGAARPGRRRRPLGRDPRATGRRRRNRFRAPFRPAWMPRAERPRRPGGSSRRDRGARRSEPGGPRSKTGPPGRPERAAAAATGTSAAVLRRGFGHAPRNRRFRGGVGGVSLRGGGSTDPAARPPVRLPERSGP